MLKGLGTLDGCAFGHKEEQSNLPNYFHERVEMKVLNTTNVGYSSQIPNLELKQEGTI